MINEDEYSREYRLISEMVDAHVMLPNESFSHSKQEIQQGDKGEIILLN